MNYIVFPSFAIFEEWRRIMSEGTKTTPYVFQIIKHEILKVYNDKTKSFDNYVGVYWTKEEEI